PPAGVLRRQEMVVDRALDFLTKASLAGQPEQPPVELQPGHCRAGLPNIGGWQRQESPVWLEVLHGTDGAGPIQLMLNNVIPRAEHCLEQTLVRSQPVKINQAIEVGEHLIGFAVRSGIHTAALQERSNDPRAVRPIVRTDDVLTELEMPRVCSKPVELAHR